MSSKVREIIQNWNYWIVGFEVLYINYQIHSENKEPLKIIIKNNFIISKRIWADKNIVSQNLVSAKILIIKILSLSEKDNRHHQLQQEN